jgi:hypothetical protein
MATPTTATTRARLTTVFQVSGCACAALIEAASPRPERASRRRRAPRRGAANACWPPRRTSPLDSRTSTPRLSIRQAPAAAPAVGASWQPPQLELRPYGPQECLIRPPLFSSTSPSKCPFGHSLAPGGPQAVGWKPCVCTPAGKQPQKAGHGPSPDLLRKLPQPGAEQRSTSRCTTSCVARPVPRRQVNVRGPTLRSDR